MRVLITGVCGFVGSSCAISLRELSDEFTIFGIDSLARSGSESNRERLKDYGITVVHGDLRAASDVEALPPADYVIDAAANPSVLAGVDGKASPRQLIEHNLYGTVELLEYCRRHTVGLIVLSSSRVYSINELFGLPMKTEGKRWQLDDGGPLPTGVSAKGITSAFSTSAPVSLYGATKLASEALAAEYSTAFGFPVWINRCGILAGAGQFGVPDQGILSYWIHSHRRRLPLRYTGFGGTGFQVRDAMHPRDLARVILKQMRTGKSDDEDTPICQLGGGLENSFSLAELTEWCDARFGAHPIARDPSPRKYDLPWLVMDARAAQDRFHLENRMGLEAIFEEIAAHAESHPRWLEMSGAI